MSGGELPGRCSVGIASEQALVAEAVRASLTDRGLRAVVVRWPGEQGPMPRHGAPRERPDVGLLISDLDRRPRLRAATLLLGHMPIPWVVLTSAPAGPLWGAALEAGAQLVLPSTTGLEEVYRAVAGLVLRQEPTPQRDREELIGRWRAFEERRQEVGQRVESLTPREREVLTMLYAGDPVARIAQLLEVSPATVRSQVKAVLRKLQVNTQLGAVAAFDDLLDLEPGAPAWG